MEDGGTNEILRVLLFHCSIIMTILFGLGCEDDIRKCSVCEKRNECLICSEGFHLTRDKTACKGMSIFTLLRLCIWLVKFISLVVLKVNIILFNSYKLTISYWKIVDEQACDCLILTSKNFAGRSYQLDSVKRILYSLSFFFFFFYVHFTSIYVCKGSLTKSYHKYLIIFPVLKRMFKFSLYLKHTLTLILW